MTVNAPSATLTPFLRGRRVEPGCELPYRVFALFGLTNPASFALDVHNASDVPVDARGVELGLILAPQLSCRAGRGTVWLPDGRQMMVSRGLGRIPPRGWRAMRFEHVPSNPRAYRGTALPCELRIYGDTEVVAIPFGLRASIKGDLAAAGTASTGTADPLPERRHDPNTLTGAFVDRLVTYLPDNRYRAMVLGVDPTIWHRRGVDICKRIEGGEPEDDIRADLRAFFGPGAGDALLDAVKEILWPSYAGALAT